MDDYDWDRRQFEKKLDRFEPWVAGIIITLIVITIFVQVGKL